MVVIQGSLWDQVGRDASLDCTSWQLSQPSSLPQDLGEKQGELAGY